MRTTYEEKPIACGSELKKEIGRKVNVQDGPPSL